MQGVVHHVGIEVTGAAGRDLHGLDTASADATGIVLGFQVTFDDGHFQLAVQRLDGRLQQRGLAGAR